MRTACLAAVALMFLPQIVPAQTKQSADIDIKEWPVPWPDTRPRDPYVDGKGRVWFVGQQGNYIAHLNPATGDFKRFEIEEGTHPHNLIVASNGTVWYTGNRNARLGRLDPNTGETKTYPMPDAAARDPHTLVLGKNGVLWFTVQGGNYVGRFQPTSGKIDLIKVPTNNARPYGIAIDSKGRPWLNLFGVNKLATIDPTSLALTEVELPRADARGRRIAITSDDRVWYVDYMGGYLGSYNPATRKFEEWALPAGANSRPYAMTVDASDRLWTVQTGPQPNSLVGFDPKRNQFILTTAIPSGARVVRHMYYHPSSKEIWFGTDAGTIGRAKLP